MKNLLSIILLCLIFSSPAFAESFNITRGSNIDPVDFAKSESFMQSHQYGFEENKGQVTGNDADKVNFVFNTGNLSVFLLNNGIAYQFSKTRYPKGYKRPDKFTKHEERQKQHDLRKDIIIETHRMDVLLVGMNTNARITAESESSDYLQYYNHNVLDVHSYGKIIYHDVYPGIDWVIYVKENKIKYDFVVNPGGNPNLIKLQSKWTDQTVLNADGSIELKSSMGDITEHSPISFQGGKEVRTQFVLEKNTFTFKLGKYKSDEVLVIDPAISWATYCGGSSYQIAYNCTTDSFGNVFITGETESSSNIAFGGHQNMAGSTGQFTDAFLVKYNSNGVRQWGTFYGGSNEDYGTSCVADNSGNIYMAGTSYSSNNISFNGHQNAFGGNADDAYLVKFNSNGVRQWATYYGDMGYDDGNCCAIDASNNIYMGGQTSSIANIASGGYQNTPYNFLNGYLVKFNSNGVRIWGSYYPKSIESCTVDNWYNIYHSGWTDEITGIAFGGHQNTLGGGVDAYLTKCNGSGVPIWSTYYGGEGGENGPSCAVDNAGNVFLAGLTNSSFNMAFNGYQDTINTNSLDAYLVKFDSTGVRQWGTYYGGSGDDYGYSCSVDASGNVYLNGLTMSGDNIASDGFQNTYGGSWDGYIVKFNASGERCWGSYYGGTGIEIVNCSKVGLSNNLYLAGVTSSSSGIASGGHQNTFGGAEDAFLAKIGQSCIPPSAPTGSDTAIFCNNASVTNLSATGNNIQWYSNPSGGIALNNEITLTDGVTYYASQMLNGCESPDRFAVTVTVNQINTPTGSPEQFFCDSISVNDLSIVGSNIQWYTTPTGNILIDSSMNLVDGNTYYASQIINGCESIDRLAVTVIIGEIVAPTGSAQQNFCNSADITDLAVVGSSIQWYSDSIGNTLVNAGVNLVNGAIYYASETINGCESIDRLAVTVAIDETAAPTGSAQQKFCNNAEISDLTVVGSNIQWYTDSTGTTLIDSDTNLINGVTYYASQTVNGCESLERLGITAIINNVNTTVSESGVTLTAFQSGATYQWIYCKDNTPVESSDNQSFTPVENGDYAVVITWNNCVDTSECFAITELIIYENERDEVMIYPNPVDNILTVRLNNENEIEIYSIIGQFIEKLSARQEYVIDVSNYAPGVYHITIGGIQSIRFVKK
ncbi:Beta-propeller repeat protein [compost metagenome]